MRIKEESVCIYAYQGNKFKFVGISGSTFCSGFDCGWRREPVGCGDIGSGETKQARSAARSPRVRPGEGVLVSIGTLHFMR